MTIDINLSEFEYLADHLHFEECRRLVAALHFKGYEQPNALDQAERKVSKDVPCLNALLHWNSAKGEGKGETHEVVEHRLRQIGRLDLADWLGRTVFHQLGEDLKRNLNDSFKELIASSEKTQNNTFLPSLQAKEKLADPSEWSAFDTICYVAVVLLLAAILGVLIKACCRTCCKRIKQKRMNKKAEYSRLEGTASDDESETLYDVNEEASASTECTTHL